MSVHGGNAEVQENAQEIHTAEHREDSRASSPTNSDRDEGDSFEDANDTTNGNVDAQTGSRKASLQAPSIASSHVKEEGSADIEPPQTLGQQQDQDLEQGLSEDRGSSDDEEDEEEAEIHVAEEKHVRGNSIPQEEHIQHHTQEDATEKEQHSERPGSSHSVQPSVLSSIHDSFRHSVVPSGTSSRDTIRTSVHGSVLTVEFKDEELKQEGLHDNEVTIKPSSPSIQSRRASNTTMDDVKLSDTASTVSHDAAESLKATETPLQPLRSPSMGGFMGFAGKLPGFNSTANTPTVAPIPSPPALDKKLPPPPPNAHTRKLTSPFSWLTRKDTSAGTKEPITSPSATPASFMDRRNTQSSIATLGSNPDLMLNKLEESGEADSGLPGRNSLKDRFKLLRMREEAGIPMGEEAEGGSIAALAKSAGLTSPSTERAPLSPGPTSPGSIAAFNPSLAPGTVAGVSAGPTASNESVDWDLWQAVVYEGPTAVARSSPEELNRAIATGIPGTIRGVVWQVLAQSKNDELESVYKDLVSRGTEKDRNSQSSNSTAFASNGSSSRDPTSSASSVHSDDHNTLSASVNASGLRSPSPHKNDPEALARAQAAAIVEQQRKVKEDAANLVKLEKAIKRDLGARTSFSKFAASAGLQDGLFGICKAYALFDDGVGYAQGMNFLVMPLLFNMPEEEAFCLLVRLMNQYHLRDLFVQDMPGLHMHLYQFERLLEDFEPALFCHLNRRQVTPHLYATQWFLTLFAYRFPLQLVLRIYDLILSEGLEAILKFGIVLMQKNVATLLAINDMGQLTIFLRDKLFDAYIDQSPSAGSILDSGFFGNAGASIDKEVYRADMLVQDACAVKITPEMLKTYATEWEEKTRTEAALAAELENLKSSNTKLATKVRRLEERVQDHDSEHAALATELVRTKVENEELKDENESLNGQVKELRKVVESQPREVEDRLKHEMDRLMTRNQEVHGENTRLEEDLVEMEKNLVQTKMAFAEIKEENENIKQRLNNMRKALD